MLFHFSWRFAGRFLSRHHLSFSLLSLYVQIVDSSGEERIANVDTAISSEHARVDFDEKTGERVAFASYYLTKPSQDNSTSVTER